MQHELKVHLRSKIHLSSAKIINWGNIVSFVLQFGVNVQNKCIINTSKCTKIREIFFITSLRVYAFYGENCTHSNKICE